VVSNYCWGASCLSYSSAAIMTSGTIGDSDVVVVYGDIDQSMQIGLPDNKCVVKKLSGHIDLVSKVVSGRTVISYLSSAGHTVVQVDGGARRVIIHIVDTITAYTGWKGSQGKDSSLIFGP
jgi:hypothetical protein